MKFCWVRDFYLLSFLVIKVVSVGVDNFFLVGFVDLFCCGFFDLLGNYNCVGLFDLLWSGDVFILDFFYLFYGGYVFVIFYDLGCWFGNINGKVLGLFNFLGDVVVDGLCYFFWF